MPLSPASRLQSATGTAGTSTSGVTSINVTLPNLTAPGSTVLVGVKALSVPIPDGWASDQNISSTAFLFRRTFPAGGEQSWTFTAGQQRWAWYVEEVAGIDTVDPVDQAANNFPGTGLASFSTGTTGTTISADTAARAVFYGNEDSAGIPGGWPSGRSYDSGFTEIAFVPNGDGTTTGDICLIVAEMYPGVTGTFECTLTYNTSGGGSVANIDDGGLIVVYRAAGTLPGGGILVTPPP